jgi:mannose-1-phosphate guanylyltransferase
VCGEEHTTLVRKALPSLPAENILSEPVARNTAAAVAWAALEVERRSPGAVQAVLPADHVIRPAAVFKKTLAAAAIEARTSGALVTFGVKPTFPATGYGYIAIGPEVASRQGPRARRAPLRRNRRSIARFSSPPPAITCGTRMFVWTTTAIPRRDAPTAPRSRRPPERDRPSRS